MTELDAPEEPIRGRRFTRSLPLWGAVLALSTATIGLAVVSNGNPVAPLVPSIIVALVWLLWVIPVRHTLLALMFCGLVFETRYESYSNSGWASPVVPPGMLLLERLNTFLPVSALSFTTLDLLLLLLGGIVLHRAATGSQKDRHDRVGSPVELGRWALVSLGGLVFALLVGMAQGGELRFAIWQFTRTLYLPLLLLLYQVAIRGPRDWKSLSRIIVVAAFIKAALAVYVRVQHLPLPLGSLWATTHSDSLLFATAFAMVVASLFENLGRASLLQALRILPVLCAAMWANNRRLAWVQVAFVMLLFLAISPMNKVKRFFIWLVPLVAVYVLVGWHVDSELFAPVKTLRSTIDAKTDASTLWREMENFNLASNIAQWPVLGLGYGNGYVEVIQLPDISSGFELYRHLPHNSLLGLYVFAGYVGFSAQYVLFAVVMFFAMRVYRFSADKNHRVVALTTAAATTVYLIQAWGDLGLGSWTGIFLLAPLAAMTGKLSTLLNR